MFDLKTVNIKTINYKSRKKKNQNLKRKSIFEFNLALPHKKYVRMDWNL